MNLPPFQEPGVRGVAKWLPCTVHVKSHHRLIQAVVSENGFHDLQDCLVLVGRDRDLFTGEYRMEELQRLLHDDVVSVQHGSRVFQVHQL